MSYRITLYLAIFFSFNTFACWIPKSLSSGIIEFRYLKPIGTHEVKIPARVGESELGSAGLFFKKIGTKGVGEFELEIPMKLVDGFLVGNFQAKSREGYSSFVSVSWGANMNTPCPIYSSKKVKLSPKNA